MTGPSAVSSMLVALPLHSSIAASQEFGHLYHFLMLDSDAGPSLAPILKGVITSSMTITTDTSLSKLFAKQSSYSSKHAVFFWVVWVILAGNLEYRWERIRKAIYLVSYLLGNLKSIGY